MLFAVTAASTRKAEARPRISSGVVSCTVVWRMATVTASAAPSSAIVIPPAHSAVTFEKTSSVTA